MPNRPIPVAEASAMIKAYNTYMQTLGVDMKQQTQSVSFKLAELMTWLNKMTELADEIRICMGDYPDGHAQANRTTVILWPYKNGQPSVYPQTTEFAKGGPDDLEGEEGEGDPKDPRPVDPYNDGQLHP